MEDGNNREAFNEMVREKNRLKQRTKTVNNNLQNLSDSDLDMSSGDEDVLDEEELKKKAIENIDKELADSDEEEVSSDESEEGDKGQIKVSFGKSAKKDSSSNKYDDKQGILGLKFMQRGEERKKGILKDQAKMLK